MKTKTWVGQKDGSFKEKTWHAATKIKSGGKTKKPKVKFVHWLVSPFPEIPDEPMFNIISSGSTVSRQTILRDYLYVAIPKFPSLKKWKKEVFEKRRCFRCWASVRGAKDLSRHRKIVHSEKGI